MLSVRQEYKNGYIRNGAIWVDGHWYEFCGNERVASSACRFDNGEDCVLAWRIGLPDGQDTGLPDTQALCLSACGPPRPGVFNPPRGPRGFNTFAGYGER